MAYISAILPYFWPGTEWTIDEDDYNTLRWAPSNVLAKPTEGEIRSHSDAVDALISDEEQRRRQQRGMADSPDYLLKAIEVIVQGMMEIRRVVDDIRSTAVAQAHTGTYTAWDANIASKTSALAQKVRDLRQIP